MLQDFFDFFEKQWENLKFPSTPLYGPMVWIHQSQSKKIRPILVFLSYYLYQKDWENIFSQAAAVELFHNFTLLHDDIMDEADLRRGKTTAHLVFGTPMTLLAGDALEIVAAQYLLKNLEDPVQKITLIEKFHQMCLDVCQGQALDLGFENDFPQWETYIEMIEKKTGYLLSFSLELGAILAKAPEKEQGLLAQLGLSLGILYQIQDDYLDFYGDPIQFGKKIGGDIIQNKKTALILLLVKQIGRMPIEKGFALKNKSEKIDYFKELFEQYQIQMLLKNKIKEEQSKIEMIFEEIPRNTQYLRFLFDYLIDRKI